MTDRLCSLDSCSNKHFARGLCGKHYQSSKRAGAFTDRECSATGCEEPFYAKSLCFFHWKREWSGVPLDRPKGKGHHGAEHWAWKEVPSYISAHQRVSAQRGKASDHPCVDCGEPAADWSYDHSGVQEHQGVGKGRNSKLRYSLDVYAYQPRCHPCHVSFDRNP